MNIRYSKIFVLWTVVSAVISLAGCRKSLPEAVRSSDLKTIERLIADGADVNVKNSEGDTPLHVAATFGREDAAEVLIANGASIASKDKFGFKPLHVAARNSFLAAGGVAKLLISNGANIHATTPGNISILHLAAEGGDPDLVELLIEKGANVNALDENLYTPLQWAVERGRYRQKEIIEILLAAGADVLIENKMHHNPLDEALLRDNEPIAKLLVEALDPDTRDRSGQTLLHRAIRRRNVKMVKLLIEHGADVNAKDAQGDTPLDVAVNYIRNKEIVDLLMSKGAQKTKDLKPPTEPIISEEQLLQEIRNLDVGSEEINKKSILDRTRLHWAARYGYQRAVELLFDKGANANVTDDALLTPLHIAVMHSELEIAKIIAEHGADINAKDEIGHTALHYAVMTHSKNVELAELLIDSGAKIDIPGPADETPLHMSVGIGDIHLTHLFLTKGADVNARNKSGATPLHRAAASGRKEIAELLIKKGADINARDYIGATPLVYALSDDPKFKAVAEMLRQHGGKTFGFRRTK